MGIVGQRVRNLRETFELSATELADKLSIKKASLSKLENGYVKNPPLALLDNLATTFNVSVDYLMGRTDQLEREPSIRLSKEEEKIYNEFLEEQERIFAMCGNISKEKLDAVMHYMRYTFEKDIKDRRDGNITTKIPEEDV